LICTAKERKLYSEECDPKMSTVKALEHALEKEGIIFVNEGKKIGVNLWVEDKQKD